VERILEGVAPLARGEDPDKGGWLARGWFVGGTLGESDFQLQYHLHNNRNPQTFVVTGVISEAPQGWRIVRLRMLSRDPWLHPLLIAGLVLFGLFEMVTHEATIVGASLLVGFVLGVFALANLVVGPTTAIGLAANALAQRIHGSVRHGRRWVVP